MGGYGSSACIGSERQSVPDECDLWAESRWCHNPLIGFGFGGSTGQVLDRGAAHSAPPKGRTQ